MNARDRAAVHAAACKLYEPEQNDTTAPTGRVETEMLLHTIWEFSRPDPNRGLKVFCAFLAVIGIPVVISLAILLSALPAAPPAGTYPNPTLTPPAATASR